jgi:4-hydroxythreonine-4-phosphate dehydrogenase
MATIFVSQGSHHSIGLEVFLKSFSCLKTKYKKIFKLIVNQASLKQHLNLLNFDYIIISDKLIFSGGTLNLTLLNKNKSIAQDSLDFILANIEKDDVLLTLPMTKEELFVNKKICSGHTEYFRNYYNNESISMFFDSYKDKLLLLTDHISVSNISDKIISQNNEAKLILAIDYLLSSEKLNEVIFSGINPHCGENGTLGDEEKIFLPLINKLIKRYPQLIVKGPFSADTIYQQRLSQKYQLFIFSYHDQGLTIFKERNRNLGLNITIGLPFKRLSVDHGTAPLLVGKNQANYECSLLSLEKALQMVGVYEG